MTHKGLSLIPSVLGGVRPNVNDQADILHRAIRYMRAEVSKARDKLDMLTKELHELEETLKLARERCNHCGSCSACVG